MNAYCCGDSTPQLVVLDQPDFSAHVLSRLILAVNGSNLLSSVARLLAPFFGSAFFSL